MHFFAVPRRRQPAMPPVPDDADAAHDAAVASSLPSDTEVALRLLLDRFPPPRAGAAPLPRLLLQSQLYDLVKNRGKVDADVSELVHANSLRRLKLGGPWREAEHGLMAAADYAAAVRRAAGDACAKAATEVERRAASAPFDAFLSSVLPAHAGVTIRAHSLAELLIGGGVSEADAGAAQSALLRAGLLARSASPHADATELLLSVPGMGGFCSALDKGRRAIAGALRPRVGRAAPRSKLEGLKLRGQLIASFIVADMVGSGALEGRALAGGGDATLRLRHEA